MLGISDKTIGHSLERELLPNLRDSALCGVAWQKSAEWPASATGAKLSVVDLFSGCGGITLGVWEAARMANRTMEVELAIDLHAEAASVYKKNFGQFSNDIRIGDITEVFPAKLSMALNSEEKAFRARIQNLDLLVGGPPCQGHSDLNNSSRRKDPRNGLYFRMVRAAKVLRPKAVLIENVPAVQHDRGHVVARARNSLVEMGYTVSSHVVNICTLGMAQSRKRHVLLATTKVIPSLAVLLQKNQKAPLCLKDVIGDISGFSRDTIYDTPSRVNAINKARIDHLFETNTYDLPNALRPKCHSEGSHSYTSMYGRLSWSKPAQTITSGFGSMGQGRFVHPEFRRAITPHEAARIQGFPDFFDFSTVTRRTALQEIIGNAVPPKLSALIVNNLIQQNAI